MKLGQNQELPQFRPSSLPCRNYKSGFTGCAAQNFAQSIMPSLALLHVGLSGACSPNAERKALRSSNFQLINFLFFALLAGYYRTLLYRDTRPLLASPPPPYAAAAAHHRRTPPSSPLPHPPPPPLPQHATAVTPESFADIPFAYRAAVIHQGCCSPGRQIPLSLNHVRSARPITWTRSWHSRGRCFVRRGGQCRGKETQTNTKSTTSSKRGSDR